MPGIDMTIHSVASWFARMNDLWAIARHPSTHDWIARDGPKAIYKPLFRVPDHTRHQVTHVINRCIHRHHDLATPISELGLDHRQMFIHLAG